MFEFRSQGSITLNVIQLILNLTMKWYFLILHFNITTKG